MHEFRLLLLLLLAGQYLYWPALVQPHWKDCLRGVWLERARHPVPVGLQFRGDSCLWCY